MPSLRTTEVKLRNIRNFSAMRGFREEKAGSEI